MSIKKLFANKYRTAKGRGQYSLCAIWEQKPDSYSVDKIDKIKPLSGKRCDYIVLCSGSAKSGIYLLEEKSKNPDIQGTHKQLQGGANFVSKHLQSGESCDFLPLLVSKGISHKDFREMKKKKVKLRGVKKEIEHIPIKGFLRKIV